jgi:hypothetical protein
MECADRSARLYIWGTTLTTCFDLFHCSSDGRPIIIGACKRRESSLEGCDSLDTYKPLQFARGAIDRISLRHSLLLLVVQLQQFALEVAEDSVAR